MLKINHQVVDVEEDWSDATLLEYLRDKVGLVGTKYGCGIGVCGACTVHVNGYAVRSCQLTIASVEGQSVTTIEGLGSEDRPHPLQIAWQQFNVPQCGYCQVGQIMTAAAYLESISHQPTDVEIREAMNSNLCRCGTYKRIAAAVASVSKGNDVKKVTT